MAENNNIIPSLYAEGSFTAIPPFDTVVDPSVNYVVEDITTIAKMQANNLDLYSLIFEPIGVSKEDYPTIVSRLGSVKGGVITLTSKNAADVYVLSTYLKSFPLVNGVTYETICIIANLGAVPPKLKDVCNNVRDHFKDYIVANLGIKNPSVFIGSVPTRGYVSEDTAATFEATRLNSIDQTKNDVVALNQATIKIAQLEAYVQQLESKVEELSIKN